MGPMFDSDFPLGHVMFYTFSLYALMTHHNYHVTIHLQKWDVTIMVSKLKASTREYLDSHRAIPKTDSVFISDIFSTLFSYRILTKYG